MVRAERGGVLHDSVMDRGIVSVGWERSGDVGAMASRDELRERLGAGRPDFTASEVAAGVSVLWRFAKEMRKGEPIVTYDPGARVCRLGRIAGPYEFDARR